MSQKKPSLGRGLADLLGASRSRATMPAASVPLAPTTPAAAAVEGISAVPTPSPAPRSGGD
ncbi:MAG TPA: hypothetical protein VN762_03255, partial [Steroidobacteraceae bacterium]|nr:hypothetical protein [Steroidobacteraceae bacterium]